MYAGVPRTVPDVVMPVPSAAEAMPRSVSFASPARSMRMFAGLTSRWMIPRAWRWSTAPAIARRIRSAWPGSIAPSRMRWASVGPSTSSMMSSTSPSSSIASYSVTTFGWLSDAATRISRRKRGAISDAEASGCSRLMATRRPSSQSSARKTDAMAPDPSRRIMRNRSATRRSCSDTPSICPSAGMRSRDSQPLERRADPLGDLDRPPLVAIDEHVDEPAGRREALAVVAEQADLVADARAPQVPDPQRRLHRLGEGERRVEGAVRLGAQADHRPAMDVESALLDQPRVDDGVEVRVVLDVVDVAVDVVVLPARRDRAAVRVVGEGGQVVGHGPARCQIRRSRTDRTGAAEEADMRHSIRITTIAVVGALAIAACGGGGGSASTATTDSSGDTTLNVQETAGVPSAFVAFGQAKGFFTKHKLKINLESSQGGATAVPSLVSGKIQVAGSNVVSLMIAASKGLPVEAIAPGTSAHGAGQKDFGALMVPK